MTDNFHILLIDDDELLNYVNCKFIEKSVSNPTVTSFLNANEAIEFLLKTKKGGLPLPEVIFLDISMPVMMGWEFLDEYTRLQIDPDDRCSIYIVTISIFSNDVRKARTYPIVKGFISKPLNVEKIRDLLFDKKHILPVAV